MSIILAVVVLCATLMVLWSGTMLIWLYGNTKPLVAVTIVNRPPAARVTLSPNIRTLIA